MRTARPRFDFNDLFIFDLANNHQGKVEHGLKIIREMGHVARANGIRGVMKFQFRDLDTFIHPAHRKASKNKHVPRFLSTRLSKEEFAKLTAAVKDAGLIPMCTPFDEASVDVILGLGIELAALRMRHRLPPSGPGMAALRLGRFHVRHSLGPVRCVNFSLTIR